LCLSVLSVFAVVIGISGRAYSNWLGGSRDRSTVWFRQMQSSLYNRDDIGKQLIRISLIWTGSEILHRSSIVISYQLL
jgi:hypothetical protein